ncbi:hypothetical protein GY45DRAFT_692727 [Cubamyces sp. BRFM 1775]|nr:hypothetical protein GY45DRAFT_692727 [Cubamyces sp. BRFM 1775]
MAARKALNSEDVLHCVFSEFSTDKFDYQRDDPLHSESARRGVLAQSACVCKAFRDIALPVLWTHLHNLAPFFRLLSTCKTVQETYLGPRALDEGPVPQEELKRLRYYGALIRSVAWNNRATPKTPGFYDYIEGSSLKQLRRLVGDAPDPLLPNLDILSWKLTLTVDPASLSILMSPNLKTLQMDSVYDRGEWQPLLEQLLLMSLPTASGLEHLSLKFNGYYSELRLSSELTRPISGLCSLRSLVLLFPTHNTWNEIRLDVVVDALQLLAPLTRLERLEFRPGHIIAGSTVPPPGSQRDVLFPNLQQLKFHVISCGPSGRILLQTLRAPSLRHLEAIYEYRDNAELKGAFAVTARCFPNLQSFWSRISHDDEGDHTWDDWLSPLTEVISPLLSMRSVEILVMPGGLRPEFTVGDADIDAISAAWSHLRVLNLAGFPPPMPTDEVEWEDIE